MKLNQKDPRPPTSASGPYANKDMTRRNVVGALGSAVGLFALGCRAPVGEEEDSTDRRVGIIRESIVGDSGLIVSGTITPGVTVVPFPTQIVTGWRNYELRLRNVFPQTAPGGGAFLALHVSGNNGATYDYSSCNATDCSLNGHYSFTNAFTIPGGSVVYSRNSALGAGAYDKQFELTQQGTHPTGVCGTVRFSDPLAVGVFKHFEWDTSYLGPNNFCRESGSGLYYGNAIPTNGSPFNAFRLMYTNANGAPTNPGGASYAFGGGSYSLWGFT